MSWVPMKKKDDKPILLSVVVRKLWPTTLLGIAGLILGSIYSPTWVLVVMPFLCSFILGIPMTYLTGRQIKSMARVEDQRYLQVPSDLSSITVRSSG